ncbi:putative integrase [Desulfobacula toluolica Tol2]|uniref:Putative integrase n=1 Tax=Desulfobacula toluolica (strain DSM 7467 / Tol2) TaxID=651182 RepID=K0NL25_DESTT|nr:putative integrase [Desulfobacula toluolica Tol2]
MRQPDRRTLIGKRDYAILRLMLTYGLQVGEVCKLTYQDLETERVKGQQKLWIRDRKGKIGRRADTDIILNGKALQAFDEWMEHCNINFESATPLFVGFRYQVSQGGLVIRWDQVRENKRLTTRSIEYMIEKYVEKAGISHGDKVISAHALRHTAFTMLAKAGVKLVDLKFLAGHQDVSTTLIYLHSVQSYEDHAGMHNPLNR